MPADFNVVGSVSLDASSLSSTARQIEQIAKNAPSIKLKFDAAPLGRINGDLAQFDKSMSAANARVLAFGASAGAIFAVTSAFKDLATTFIDTEAKFQRIQTVLQATTSSFSNFKGAIFDIAKNTGQSWQAVSDAAEQFSHQGLRMEDVLRRTNAAMILTRSSGMSTAESVEILTSSINKFTREALNEETVLNKLVAVSNKFAVSQKDLAEALVRAGASAQDAGVDFDKFLALTTSLQQITQRGGSVIGNSLKSIFTRVERSSTLDTLEAFNVQTRDLQGNVLNADRILQNLAKTYKTLSSAEQASVSERVAGIQQINQLKVLMIDLARANSVYDQALVTSRGSTDEAIKKNELLNQTLTATLNKTKQNAAEFASTTGGLVFTPIIKSSTGFLDSFFESFKQKDQDAKSAGQKIGEGFLKGVGEVLNGPGLILGITIAINVLKKLGMGMVTIARDYGTLNKGAAEQANLQSAINSIVNSGNTGHIQRLSLAKDLTAEYHMAAQILTEINASQLAAASRFSGTGKVGAMLGANFVNEKFTPGTTRIPGFADLTKEPSSKVSTVAKHFTEAHKALVTTNPSAISIHGVPNFADPLTSAINREKSAGLSISQIRVEKSPQLVSFANPYGLAVTNTRDEPQGVNQGINRAIKEGKDPSNYGTIPNFAEYNTGSESPFTFAGFKQPEKLWEGNISQSNDVMEQISSLSAKKQRQIESFNKRNAPTEAISSIFKEPNPNPAKSLTPSSEILASGPKPIIPKIEYPLGKEINDALSKIDLSHIDLTQGKSNIKEQVSKIIAKKVNKDLEFSHPQDVALIESKASQYIEQKAPTIASQRIGALHETDRVRRDAATVARFTQELGESRLLHEEDNKGFGGFLKEFGGKKSYEKTYQEQLKSSEFEGLSKEDQYTVRKRGQEQIQTSNDRLNQRRQGAAFAAALAIPVVTSMVSAQFGKPESRGAKLTAGLGEAAGTGIGLASAFGFTPLGIGLGVAVTGLSAFKVAMDSTRKSVAEYDKELADAQGKFTEQKAGVGAVFGARGQFNEAVERGESTSTINRISQALQDSIKGISDPTLRMKAASANTVEKQSDLMAEIQHLENQEVSTKGLLELLEKSAESHRTLGVDWSGGKQSFTKEEKTGVESLITGALPLSADKESRDKQISQLKSLQSKGDAGLGEVQNILGQLSDEIKGKLVNAYDAEKNAIARNIIERNLSAAAIAEEGERINVTASTLLNLKVTLDALSKTSALSFGIQNIRNKGQRDLSLQSGSQSLSILDQFLTPESKNRYESQQKLASSKGEAVTETEKIATGFVTGINNLTEYVQKESKGRQSDYFPVGGGTGEKNESFIKELNEIKLSAFKQGENPIDAANRMENVFQSLIQKLQPNANGAPNLGENKELANILSKYLEENKNTPITFVNEEEKVRNALIENSKHLQDLNITIGKQLNFLGSGNFESKTDISKIQQGLAVEQSLSNRSATNPLAKRLIYKSGNRFQDAFSGSPIDTVAENRRYSGIINKVATERLEIQNLGLNEGNVGATAETRSTVQKAEFSKMTDTLNQLKTAARMSENIPFLDRLSAISPQQVEDSAKTKALKQVPYTDIERKKFETITKSADEALKNKNLSPEQRSALTSARNDVRDKLGPTEVFKTLNDNVAKLDDHFESGIKGDFTRLQTEADKSAAALMGLTGQIELVNKAYRESSVGEEQKKASKIASEALKNDTQSKISDVDNHPSIPLGENGQPLFKTPKANLSPLIGNKRILEILSEGIPGLDKKEYSRIADQSKKIHATVGKALQDRNDNKITQSEFFKIQQDADRELSSLEVKNHASGLLTSLSKEKRDILNGVGGARSEDKPFLTKLNGGLGVMNTGEVKTSIDGKDTILNRSQLKNVGHFAEGIPEGMHTKLKTAQKTKLIATKPNEMYNKGTLGESVPGSRVVSINKDIVPGSSNVAKLEATAINAVREVGAHEMFHSGGSIFNKSESVAGFVGGWSRLRGASKLERLTSGIRGVSTGWVNQNPIYQASKAERFGKLGGELIGGAEYIAGTAIEGSAQLLKPVMPFIKPVAKLAGKLAAPLTVGMEAYETKKILNHPELMDEESEKLSRKGVLGRTWAGISNPVRSFSALNNDIINAISPDKTQYSRIPVQHKHPLGLRNTTSPEIASPPVNSSDNISTAQTPRVDLGGGAIPPPTYTPSVPYNGGSDFNKPNNNEPRDISAQPILPIPNKSRILSSDIYGKTFNMFGDKGAKSVIDANNPDHYISGTIRDIQQHRQNDIKREGNHYAQFGDPKALQNYQAKVGENTRLNLAQQYNIASNSPDTIASKRGVTEETAKFHESFAADTDKFHSGFAKNSFGQGSLQTGKLQTGRLQSGHLKRFGEGSSLNEFQHEARGRLAVAGGANQRREAAINTGGGKNSSGDKQLEILEKILQGIEKTNANTSPTNKGAGSEPTTSGVGSAGGTTSNNPAGNTPASGAKVEVTNTMNLNVSGSSGGEGKGGDEKLQQAVTILRGEMDKAKAQIEALYAVNKDAKVPPPTNPSATP